MKTKQQVLIAFCLLLVTTVGFWACRKQDFKTDDLQIATKELQTWLSTNGGTYNKGQLLTKDVNGRINHSTLNWGQIRHTNANDKDFYEVPFVFTNSNTGNTAAFGTNNSLAITEYKMIFQKSASGSIIGRIETITKQDTSLSKQLKATSFDKMYFFDDLQGNRKAVWVGLENNT